MKIMKASNKRMKKRFAAALALKHARRFEEALAAYDGMEDLPAEDLYEVMFERAHTLLEMGRLEDCLHALDRLLAISAEDPEAWYLKSLALEKQGKSAEAEKCWKRSVKEAKKWMEGEHPCEYWEMHGFDLDEKGSWWRCELCQDALIRLDSANLEAWHEKANSLCDMGRHAESLPLYDKALEMGPDEDDYPFVLLNKGQALTSLGRYDEAVALYDIALADPDDNFDRIGETWFARGNTLLLAGRFEEALGSYEEAASRGYWHFGGVSGKAHALEKLGRYAEALECCEEFLKRYPKERFMLKLKALVLRKLRGAPAVPGPAEAGGKEV
ncbi:MAG: tetratricopeptide repeat protein [Chloroflexi bacterium]|jgi:superkiller protein 3|nr:tetratricopeptide repeat protein [Chloroflexota bacterium]